MADYDISSAFEAIENELIDSMMRNFSRHRAEETKEGYNWSQWQSEQLKSLEQYRKSNAKKFNKQFSEINGKVSEMLKTSRADGNAKQEAKILQAIKDGFKAPDKPSKTSTAEFFKVNDRKLDALIKSTTDDLKRAETAVLRMSNDKYRKAIFNAQVYANSGAGTYEKAVDMACRDMLRAGLNCVEYKNGARHTLSDYAEMAIRTANKRAYLRGEGEKRAEWGISTVVVNSRQGGCPDCAQYIGCVFIDDVYSNGSKKDGDYPLLSEAISNGLFHPRCKDSTSTYYEGITTLKKATDEEINDMKRQEVLEQQKSHAENESKKYGRIAKYSLDEYNHDIYSKRAEVWQDKAELIGKKIDEIVAILPKHDIIKARSGKMALEYQRYGRNKNTLVNKTYIDSGEYRRKFDSATDNPDLNRSMYNCSKIALKHRSGTTYEDMYWFDGKSGEIILSVTDSTEERTITYSDKIKNTIKKNNNIVTLHTHPSSMPPSISDINSCFLNNYKKGFVICHNGTIFGYTSNEVISERLYSMYVQRFINEGFDEYESQIKTLNILSKSYDIKIWEVKDNG